MEHNSRSKALGVRGREAREAKGWSLRQLAATVGMAHSFIRGVERGRYRTAYTDKLTALARALDIPPEDLLTLSGYRVPESLPSFGPYLRSRYGEDLPEAEIAHLADYFELLRAKYDENDHGGVDGGTLAGGRGAWTPPPYAFSGAWDQSRQ